MKKAQPTGDLSGFLDRDTAVRGEIVFKDTLRIDGKFEGTIRSGKTLVIGESAVVDAEIEVGALFVNGCLRGKATAAERVELAATARVQSDVTTSVLIVKEGALFEGRCVMQQEVAGAARLLDSAKASKLKEVKSTI